MNNWMQRYREYEELCFHAQQTESVADQRTAYASCEQLYRELMSDPHSPKSPTTDPIEVCKVDLQVYAYLQKAPKKDRDNVNQWIEAGFPMDNKPPIDDPEFLKLVQNLEFQGKLKANDPKQDRPNQDGTVDSLPLSDPKQNESGTTNLTADKPAMAPPKQAVPVELLNVYTNNLASERFADVAELLSSTTWTANDKLNKLHGLLPIPPTAPAEALGQLLGVTKQAICKCEWWQNNRKGTQAESVGRRETQHRKRKTQRDYIEADDD